MPGLPKAPAAEKIDVDADGRISACFNRYPKVKKPRSAERRTDGNYSGPAPLRIKSSLYGKLTE